MIRAEQATARKICGSKKCGEYNMLVCISEKGHSEPEHCYVVDHENDYSHNKRIASKTTEAAKEKT